MAWDDGQTAGARFEHATEAAARLHPHWSLGAAYGGFTKALSQWSPQLAPAIAQRLRQQMLERYGDRGRWQGWWLVAADGSRVEAPRSVDNQALLGCAGRDKTGPQVFATVVWQLRLGMPWSYRVGPGTDSERCHLHEMLDDLAERSLVVADAGFISYALCQRLMTGGHAFLLRVGGNVTLLEQLGYAQCERNRVYLWPQKQQQHQQPPLVLRLIRLVRGSQAVYLVTNLDESQLSDEEAGWLYEQRWGIEVFYRSYKQTLERHTLLSRTAVNCLLECEWTLLALWLLALVTVRRLIPLGIEPRRWSPARARDAVRAAMRGNRYRRRAPLPQRLALAVRDNYQRQRPKHSRDYPRKKRERPPGPPKIKPATPKEIFKAQRLRKTLARAP